MNSVFHELGNHLGRQVIILKIWERCDELYRHDHELRQANLEREDRNREIQSRYLFLRSHALGAARELCAIEPRTATVVQANVAALGPALGATLVVGPGYSGILLAAAAIYAVVAGLMIACTRFVND